MHRFRFPSVLCTTETLDFAIEIPAKQRLSVSLVKSLMPLMTDKAIPTPSPAFSVFQYLVADITVK